MLCLMPLLCFHCSRILFLPSYFSLFFCFIEATFSAWSTSLIFFLQRAVSWIRTDAKQLVWCSILDIVFLSFLYSPDCLSHVFFHQINDCCLRERDTLQFREINTKILRHQWISFPSLVVALGSEDDHGEDSLRK